jgi:hypothetical protein
MASLHRAIVVLRNLNVSSIPRDIRNGLRQLQDAYSEELDFGGTYTRSQGSIEGGEPEMHDHEEGSDAHEEDSDAHEEDSDAHKLSSRGTGIRGVDQTETQ